MENGKDDLKSRRRERGRENGSFPVAEILKPLGFKNILRSEIFGGGGHKAAAGFKLPADKKPPWRYI